MITKLLQNYRQSTAFVQKSETMIGANGAPEMRKQQAVRFGSWLRQRRLAAGLSSTQLAKLADTTDGTIVRLEHGKIAAPAPDKLSRIGAALGVSLADIYAMAGYAITDELPSFQPYLRRKYRDLPAAAVADLDQAFARIVAQHGYQPDGPRAGEDESPEEQVNK